MIAFYLSASFFFKIVISLLLCQYIGEKVTLFLSLYNRLISFAKIVLDTSRLDKINNQFNNVRRCECCATLRAHQGRGGSNVLARLIVYIIRHPPKKYRSHKDLAPGLPLVLLSMVTALMGFPSSIAESGFYVS